MTYDAAGNLTNDTYTGMGGRTYDAENKITQAADNTGQTSRYTYDGSGNRVRRQVASSQEEWQVYGFGGELLAEYRASSPASAPEKEYGYRNGQLLVTATDRFNVALAANGAVASRP
jgi:YD repeat-containing protein